MKENILVPKDRLGVIKDKKVREEIEKRLEVKLEFIENSIEIDGEGLNLYQAKNIIKAMARGFSPEKAFKLFNEEEQLDIIELRDVTEHKLKVIKARLIGTNGKTRKMIEFYSDCSVSIYGKTVSIIGSFEKIQIAKEAVMMVINGAKHTNVYRFLELQNLEKTYLKG